MASKRPPGTYSPSARTGRRGGWSGSVAGMVRRAGSDALLMSLRSTVPVGSSAASIGAAETAWIGRGRAGLLRRSSAIPATGAGLGSRGGGRRDGPRTGPAVVATPARPDLALAGTDCHGASATVARTTGPARSRAPEVAARGGGERGGGRRPAPGAVRESTTTRRRWKRVAWSVRGPRPSRGRGGPTALRSPSRGNPGSRRSARRSRVRCRPSSR